MTTDTTINTTELPPIGTAIRHLREKKKMTLAALAVAVYGEENRRGNLSVLESNQKVPRLATLAALAEALGTTPEAIISLARKLEREAAQKVLPE